MFFDDTYPCSNNWYLYLYLLSTSFEECMTNCLLLLILHRITFRMVIILDNNFYLIDFSRHSPNRACSLAIITGSYDGSIEVYMLHDFSIGERLVPG